MYTVPTEHLEQPCDTPSRFLRLPKELRESIYETALGGHLVHVGGLDNSITWRLITICEAHIDEWDMLNSLEAPSSTWPPCGSFGSRHRENEIGSCFNQSNVKYKLCLNLLLTCRQVHHEARMVPFTHNAFGLHIPFEIGSLGARIGDEHLKQIRHLIVYVADRSRAWRIPGLTRETVVSRDLSMLSAGKIRNLNVFIALSSPDEDHITSTKEQDQRVRGLRLFREVRPERVRVLIDQCSGLSEEGRKKVRLAKFDGAAWVERIKAMILGGTEGDRKDEGSN